MNIRVLMVFGLLLALSCVASAQKATKFTSAYTSLGTGCKVLRGTAGSDDAKVCAGPGGYQVRVYSSAATTHIVAELRGRDDSFPLATVRLDFKESKSRLEWRLANGKPFAAILRVPKYAALSDGEVGLGKVLGEELVVTGLKGTGTTSTAIDAKSPNANAKAREAADSSYTSKN